MTISGRHEVNHITQLCFGTSRGRTSEVFGSGKGQSFSALAPRAKDGNYFRLQYMCGRRWDIQPKCLNELTPVKNLTILPVMILGLLG